MDIILVYAVKGNLRVSDMLFHNHGLFPIALFPQERIDPMPRDPKVIDALKDNKNEKDFGVLE